MPEFDARSLLINVRNSFAGCSFSNCLLSLNTECASNDALPVLKKDKVLKVPNALLVELLPTSFDLFETVAPPASWE